MIKIRLSYGFAIYTVKDNRVGPRFSARSGRKRLVGAKKRKTRDDDDCGKEKEVFLVFSKKVQHLKIRPYSKMESIRYLLLSGKAFYKRP